MNAKWIFALSFGVLISCSDQEKPQPKAKTEVKKEAPKKIAAKKPDSKKKEAKKASDEAVVTVNADGVAEVTLEGTDAMQYTTKKFTVAAGQKVKLTLKHIGKLPKNAMGHNVVILKAGVEPGEFATAAQAAIDNDYFPKDKADQTIAHTALIGGGESTTIEFTAPAEGTYKYICTYPGHWSMMQGELIVSPAKG